MIRLQTFTLLCLATVVLAACNTAGEAPVDETTSETGETGGTGDGIDVAELYACEELEFTEFRPLSGAGWVPGMGLTDDSQTEYIVHTTQIYTRPEGMDAFIELSGRISTDADASTELIGLALGGDAGCGVSRTLGVWKSTAGLYELTVQDAHLEAMSRTLELSYSGRVTHWTATREELAELDWDVVRAKIADVPPSALYE